MEGTHRRTRSVILPDCAARYMIVGTWPWLALILRGGWHGLNPGMGWLFSVALGLQQRSRRAVFAALMPIAFGHALAIGMVVLLVYGIGAVVPFRWLQVGVDFFRKLSEWV